MNWSREKIYKALFNLVTQNLSVQGNTHNGTTTIDGLSSTRGLCFGEKISGPGIPAGAYITSFNEDTATITISQKATADATGVTFSINPWVYTSRQVVAPEDLNDDRRPALIQVEFEEDYAPQFSGQPTYATLGCFLMVVVSVQGYNGDGIELVNARVDALEDLLKPSPLTQQQTLGFVNGCPLVQHCWIEGKIVKVSGDLDGTGVATIPIKILVPA